MILWRISNHETLDGVGGLSSSARWHNKGALIVYLSESPAVAMLEVLVNYELGPEDVPDTYKLLEVNCPEGVAISRLSNNALPKNWNDNTDLTREIGNEWLAKNQSVLLRVPSVVVPHCNNYLFNPRHPDANRCKILSCINYPYDRRLFSKQ